MSQRILLPRQTTREGVGGNTSSQRDEEKRDTSPSSSSNSRKRGPLISVACNACRARKVKCDGKKPHCSNCSKRTTPCTYDESSKAERLRVVQERLREAHDEIDSLRRHIEQLTKDTTSRPRESDNSTSLAQAGGNLDRLQTKVSELQTDIPAKPSDTETQQPIEGSSQIHNRETTTSDSSHSDVPTNSASPLHGNILVIMPTPMASALTSVTTVSPLAQFGSQPFDSAQDVSGLLRVYQEESETNLYTPLYHMIPLNLVAHDEVSKPCILQHLRCRECLAEGIPLEDVLGSEILDVTQLVSPDTLGFVHPFARWVFSYVDAFSGPHGLDWGFKLAAVYCMFHLMRWLVHPTAENFARVPDFVKPTPLQLFIPHSFWINFVILPGTRDQYILHPHAHQLRHWTQMFLNARIQWPSEDIGSTVTLDPVTNCFHIAPEFERAIRQLENWYLPF